MMSEIDTGMHYPINLDKLPPSWIAAFVGDFCDGIQSGFACGRHSDSDIGVPHLRPMNISRNGELDFEVVKYVASDFDERRLSEDDVLFNNTNSPELIGKTAYVTQKGHGLAFSNHMTRLKFHLDINSKFGAYQLHYLWMARYFLHGCVKHVNQASVSATELARSIPLVVSPINEQHRIVAKIEELFSELDKGIENLKTAQAQLKVYRQALLKHAFEGKLTAQWRAENQDKLESAEALLKRIQQERAQRYQQQLADWEASGKQGSKPKPPKSLPPLTAEELAELPELPEGWGWVKLGELTWSVKDGPHFSPKYVEQGIPFISGGNVRPDGVDFENTKFISQELYEKLCQRCKPEVGDILYTKGGTTGIARVNTYDRNFNVWVHVAVLKLTSVVKPFYLQHALNSSFCYSQSQKFTHGVGNQDLGLTRMIHIILAICSIEEQEEVIKIVDDKMSVIDQLDQTITTALQQAEALRQSILKKAFSGQLVPQDPKDEPASELLARIRAERDAPSAKPKLTNTTRKSL